MPVFYASSSIIPHLNVEPSQDFFSWKYICLCLFPSKWSHSPPISKVIHLLITPDLYLEFQTVHSTSALQFSQKHHRPNMSEQSSRLPFWTCSWSIILLLVILCTFSPEAVITEHNWLHPSFYFVESPIYSNSRKIKGIPEFRVII